jgi:hypothetical protein
MNVVEVLLRTLCVREGEPYSVTIQWSEGEGALLRVACRPRSGETEYMPVPVEAVATFVGVEAVPPKAIAVHNDVMRFKDPAPGTQASG